MQKFLTSYDLNYQYTYLACLLCLEPEIWAGTSSDHPIALEAWEVEKIMQYLDSPDALAARPQLVRRLQRVRDARAF